MGWFGGSTLVVVPTTGQTDADAMLIVMWLIDLQLVSQDDPTHPGKVLRTFNCALVIVIARSWKQVDGAVDNEAAVYVTTAPRTRDNKVHAPAVSKSRQGN